MTNEYILKVLRDQYPNGHPDFIPLCFEEMKLHSDKNKDYAGCGDPLGNFYRRAATAQLYGLELADPPLVALWDSLKQLDAIMQMLTTGYNGKVEGIEARLLDMSVYAKLARILFRETRKKADGT